MKLDCKEFLNQDCEESGDCFEGGNKVSRIGLKEAEEGQCNDQNDMQTDMERN
jgi:hypothetical protein